MYLNAYLRACAYPINNKKQCVCIQYSLVLRRSGGEGEGKERLVHTVCACESPFCDDNVFVWVGFAHDVDICARALRSRLATNSISTVCSRYGQSSTHSCSIDLQFLFEIIDGDGGRHGNSEALVGHIDRTLVSTNKVSTRFCQMLECFSCF